MTHDERIRDIALEVIQKHCMKQDWWRVTRLGSAFPGAPSVQEGELPIVSASFPQGDWYVWTTRRLIARCDGVSQELPSADISKSDFGMFKGSPVCMTSETAPLETLVAVIHGRTGHSIRFRFELGYASMAPIYCAHYWAIKHPILHKLLTPAERAAYRASRTG